jgi:hypothetical protein
MNIFLSDDVAILGSHSLQITFFGHLTSIARRSLPPFDKTPLPFNDLVRRSANQKSKQ